MRSHRLHADYAVMAKVDPYVLRMYSVRDGT